MEKSEAMEMVFTRLPKKDIKALEIAADGMKDMKPSRLIRIIIQDWLEKFSPKNI